MLMSAMMARGAPVFVSHDLAKQTVTQNMYTQRLWWFGRCGACLERVSPEVSHVREVLRDSVQGCKIASAPWNGVQSSKKLHFHHRTHMIAPGYFLFPANCGQPSAQLLD